MNDHLKTTLGVVALSIVSFVGLRDTGVFVQDHATTVASGASVTFAVEEEANIIGTNNNGYLVQKGNAKVTVPKYKILVTEGPVQKFIVKDNGTIRQNGVVVRNLFLGETIDTVEIKENVVIGTTDDGITGEVALSNLESVDGPYITEAKATQNVELKNENGVLKIKKSDTVKVVSFVDGKFVIIDDNFNAYQIESKYLNFGQNGIKPSLNPATPAPKPVQAPPVPTTARIAPNPNKSVVENAINSAHAKIGSPYVWGATGDGGYDCSGLVYSIYVNELGLKGLPRTSSAQSTFGNQVPREQLQAGDLVFFNTTGGGVSHVGIYIGNDQFIHASSGAKQVKINKLSEKYYDSRFVNATRVL